MWDDLKKLWVGGSVAAFMLLIALFLLGMKFVIGWTNGMKYLVTDYGVLTGADILGNEHFLYGVAVCLTLFISGIAHRT